MTGEILTIFSEQFSSTTPSFGNLFSTKHINSYAQYIEGQAMWWVKWQHPNNFNQMEIGKFSSCDLLWFGTVFKGKLIELIPSQYN